MALTIRRLLFIGIQVGVLMTIVSAIALLYYRQLTQSSVAMTTLEMQKVIESNSADPGNCSNVVSPMARN
jgi:hypothetical protein